MGRQSEPRNMHEQGESGFPVDENKWEKEIAEISSRNEFKLSNSEQRRNKVMERQLISGDLPELDEEGFLVDARRWTEEVAQILAQRDEVPINLTENHWIVIGYMREYYLEYRSSPPIRMIARRTGFSLARLKELFPDGLLGTAWKYAGLPLNAVRAHHWYPK
ncbi:TusE/DsrC/DsvC family sulfur relay protein [Chloroflexota bacterium]